MKKSLKIASVAAVLLLAMGLVAVAFVYANPQPASTANNEEKVDASYDFSSVNETLKHSKPMKPVVNPGLDWFKKFLAHANATEVNGTVVSEFKGMLILGSIEGQVRILLPEYWSLDTEVIGRAKLFNSTFSAPGQNVTVRVLESVLLERPSFSINVMVGYEVINATGTHAYAVLPFNIETGS